MANRKLYPMYKQLFGEDFSYDSFAMRLKMQKGIYLLQELGVAIGDYRFSWYKHGPYSQELLDDMYIAQSIPSLKLDLSSDSTSAVKKLRETLRVPDNSKYDSADWAECLGSLHYLRKNVCSLTVKDDDLLKELVKRKPHLNDIMSNNIALQYIQKLFD